VALPSHANELKSSSARLQGLTDRIDTIDQVHLSSLYASPKRVPPNGTGKDSGLD
jgi:hypothetical protein